MSDFVNTVDSIGDEALTNSIIDRSITEIFDNYATSIGSDAFNCCYALTTADFPGATSIGISAFRNCSALTALILRSETMVSLGSTNAFTSTPIASGTGYIYVPAALVDSYKAATNWSTYANQIRAIEDYPVEVNGKYSWEAVAYYISQGTYATEYAVGDTIAMDLGDDGIVEMEIAAFDTDDKNGGGKAPITFIAKNLLATSKRFNPRAVTNSDGTYQDGTGSIGGWEKSELRSYLRDTILSLFPTSLSSRIVTVVKTQAAHDTAGSAFTQTTNDSIWIPSEDEVSSSGVYSAIFTDNASRIRTKYGGSAASYWLRDAQSQVNWHKSIAESGAGSGTNAAYSEKGVCIGFCVG